VYDEPIEGTEARKRYLVLYDGVPGGTGYLKELMTHPSQLEEVFRMAYDALAACECRSDESKDGCYACLLAYRGRHFHERTSRAAALDLLGRILQHWGTLKTTDRLDHVRLNRLLESELEAAFLEALQRQRDDEPERRLEPRVINGKKGYYLTMPDYGNWLLEPQVDLGPDKGVRVSSRADFIMYPERPLPGELPIAIFTDGYEWHADPLSGNLRTGRDSAQRLAIVRSGKYRIWSLTWSDVYERLGRTGEPQGNLLAGSRLGTASSFDLLLTLLTTRRATGFGELARHVAMEALVAHRCDGAQPEALATALASPGLVHWPEAGVAPGSGSAAPPAAWYYGVLSTDDVAGFIAVPHADVVDKSLRRLRVWLRLMDDRAAGGGSAWKRAWREFLRVSNVMQFLPELAFMTSTGLQEGLYGSLLDAEMDDERQPSNAALELRLADVLDAGARAIVMAADQADVPLPEAGFEIADDQGEIVAVAELAWPDERVCVLTNAQIEYAGAARAAGWVVWLVDDATADPQKVFADLRKRNT
jgi:DEAD/DEAH box helicase domain-containing protein